MIQSCKIMSPSFNGTIHSAKKNPSGTKENSYNHLETPVSKQVDEGMVDYLIKRLSSSEPKAEVKYITYNKGKDSESNHPLVEMGNVGVSVGEEFFGSGYSINIKLNPTGHNDTDWTAWQRAPINPSWNVWCIEKNDVPQQKFSELADLVRNFIFDKTATPAKKLSKAKGTVISEKIVADIYKGLDVKS